MKPRSSLQSSQQPPTGSTLNQTNPIQILPNYFFVDVNIIPPLRILFHACLFQNVSFLHALQPNFAVVPVLTCMLHALCMSSSSLYLSPQYSLNTLCTNNCIFYNLPSPDSEHCSSITLRVWWRQKCVGLFLKMDRRVSSTHNFISARSM